MDERHPAVHPFKIAPDRFCRIDRKYVRNKHDKNENSDGFGEPRDFRPVFYIDICEIDPEGKNNLNDDPECEVLQRNIRKEHIWHTW